MYLLHSHIHTWLTVDHQLPLEATQFQTPADYIWGPEEATCTSEHRNLVEWISILLDLYDMAPLPEALAPVHVDAPHKEAAAGT